MNYILLKDACVEWIRGWFEKNGKDCCAVLGMSGGKDSTVAAALCREALGADRVIGVAMPAEGQSLNEADEICRYLGIRYLCIPIGSVLSSIHDSVVSSSDNSLAPDEFRSLRSLHPSQPDGWAPPSNVSEGGHTPRSQQLSDELPTLSKQAEQNIPPRVRMTVLYAVSQSMNGRVVNTCNLSEDWIGYATRWGDAVGDFSPLGELVVQEIRGIGHALGLPSKWVDKTPDDGLPHSCPDEQKLGFTYEMLDRYIRTGQCDDPAVKEKIDGMHARNLFKMSMPESFKP